MLMPLLFIIELPLVLLYVVVDDVNVDLTEGTTAGMTCVVMLGCIV